MTSNISYGLQTAQITRSFSATGSSLVARWSDAGVTPVSGAQSIQFPGIHIDLLPDEDLSLDAGARQSLVPNSILFSFNGKQFFDRDGTMYRDFDTATGSATACGSIDYSTGAVMLTSYGNGSDSTVANPVIISCVVRPPNSMTSFARFRTPSAPIRPQSLTVRATSIDGLLVTGTSQANGPITGTGISGTVDYETGVVVVNFGSELNDNDGAPDLDHRSEDWYQPEARYNIGTEESPNWRVWSRLLIDPASILYNVVTYTFLPLDQELIGLNPVRLPSDGRVPIFKDGYILVIHDTVFEILPDNLTSGQVVALARGDLAEVILRDQNGLVVDTAQWTVVRTTGQITMTNPLNLAAYTQPLIAEHRIEDMTLLTDTQISGELSMSRALTHDYTAANSYVSSALLFGDLQARVVRWFDQQTWTGVWSSSVIGSSATASYNDVTYPPIITNSGAITQRWSLVFTSSSVFNIVSEDIGIIGTGNTGANCAPVNPVTGQPYFFIDLRGWGAGWASGNCLRFDTDGCIAPIWIARTTKQSTNEEVNDNFRMQIRGDAD